MNPEEMAAILANQAGAIAAHKAVLLALIATHPAPRQFAQQIDAMTTRAEAISLAQPVPDKSLETESEQLQLFVRAANERARKA